MGKRRILLDTRPVVAVDGGISHRFWPARRHGSPVLVGDKPWERWGASIFGNVHHDQGRYRMWYTAWPEVPPPGNASYVAYAESSDGITWDKPDLDIEAFQGRKPTNLLNLVRTVPSIIIEPDAENPTERYKAGGYIGAESVRAERGLDYPGRGFYVAHSPDGLHWQEYPSQGPVGTIYDVGTFIRDEPRGRYLGMVKQMVRYDLADRRSVALIQSQDFRAWTAPRLALVADALDDQMARQRGLHHAEFYGMGLDAYEDFLVGFIWIYWASLPLRPGYRHGMWGQMDVQLVYSYDGVYWHRTPDRQPFISLGQRGDFDANQIYTATRPTHVGDEVRLYYTGEVHEHAFYYDKSWRPRTDIPWQAEPFFNESRLSFASLQRDRYASLSTCGQGSFTVAHGRVDGRHLRVNARAPYGSVRAQMLDRGGSPLPGFDLDSCQPFSGDSLDAELRWQNQILDTIPTEREVRVQFVLDNADVFAYQFTDD
ncbi:MAG: hypothetical protein KIT87_14230 [Anaerolineae bacterium]|nr:hypothetical protein [Anaerolineae bacterium]